LIAAPWRGEGGRGKKTGKKEFERRHLDLPKTNEQLRSLFQPTAKKNWQSE
jgi:hypothetical protein